MSRESEMENTPVEVKDKVEKVSKQKNKKRSIAPARKTVKSKGKKQLKKKTISAPSIPESAPVSSDKHKLILSSIKAILQHAEPTLV